MHVQSTQLIMRKQIEENIMQSKDIAQNLVGRNRKSYVALNHFSLSLSVLINFSKYSFGNNYKRFVGNNESFRFFALNGISHKRVFIPNASI